MTDGKEPDDVVAWWKEYQTQDTGEPFADWLCKVKECEEEKDVAFVILTPDSVGE